MKSVRLNEKPSPWGLFQVKTLVFGDLGLSPQPKYKKRLAELDAQVTKFVDPLKLSPFLSYPTDVFRVFFFSFQLKTPVLSRFVLYKV